MEKLLTLARRQSPLAQPEQQRAILADPDRIAAGTFAQVVAQHDSRDDSSAPQSPVLRSRVLRSSALRTLQVNVGKLCNMTCSHCHVDAGPDRRESMSEQTAAEVLRFLEATEVETLDITGGAPEMNPNFRRLVTAARSLGKQVIDRCNLTILLAKGFDDLPEFLAEQQVNVVASLPCYLEENCDAQRGEGTFTKSIEAIRRLNSLGYARPNTPLRLDLVYNPLGTALPPDQATLEQAYREQLRARFGIEFNRLFTITNMPVSRFLEELIVKRQYEAYMQKLISRFNPDTLDALMCRSLISVDWQGYLYDCDFNQMLDMAIETPRGRLHIRDATTALIEGREILTGNHCFGCTAGCGSSCSGVLT